MSTADNDRQAPIKVEQGNHVNVGSCCESLLAQKYGVR